MILVAQTVIQRGYKYYEMQGKHLTLVPIYQNKEPRKVAKLSRDQTSDPHTETLQASNQIRVRKKKFSKHNR